MKQQLWQNRSAAQTGPHMARYLVQLFFMQFYLVHFCVLVPCFTFVALLYFICFCKLLVSYFALLYLILFTFFSFELCLISFTFIYLFVYLLVIFNVFLEQT